MAWKLAQSLEKLRDQVNAAYPNRSKVSDGTIGDAAHTAGASDHNPDKNGIVKALDLTDDPKNGFSAQQLADALTTSRDARINYIIWNRQILLNWKWQKYAGNNPHNKHIHISVNTSNCNDVSEWKIGGIVKPEEEFLKVAHLLMLNENASQADLNSLRGFTRHVDVLYALDKVQKRKDIIKKLNNYDKIAAEKAELERYVREEAQPEIEKLRASKADPDAVQLKELIKKIVKE